MSTTTWRVAVIGGGISGLAAAHRLQELCASDSARSISCCSKPERGWGGSSARGRLPAIGSSLAPIHSSPISPGESTCAGGLGLKSGSFPPMSAIAGRWSCERGGRYRFPRGFNLLAPVDVGAVLRSPLFSWPGKLRMAFEYFLPRGASAADESLANFVRRRFGRQALERLVQPLVGGIYTSDPEKLSLRATMPRFLEMEREHRSLIRALRRQSREMRDDSSASGARYGLFATLAGGVSELIDTLREKVERGATVQFETEVQGFSPNQTVVGSSPNCRLEPKTASTRWSWRFRPIARGRRSPVSLRVRPKRWDASNTPRRQLSSRDTSWPTFGIRWMLLAW